MPFLRIKRVLVWQTGNENAMSIRLVFCYGMSSGERGPIIIDYLEERVHERKR